MQENNAFNQMLAQQSRKEILSQYASELDGAPSVYCGTYRKYNEGSLYGMWIDLTKFDSYDEFIEFCQFLHRDEDDPELMYQDYENFPREWYSESGMGEEVFDRIQAYGDLDDDDREIIKAYMDLYSDEDPDFDDVKSRHMGKFDDSKAFGEWLFDQLEFDNISSWLTEFIDYEAYGDAMLREGYSMDDDGHVFSDK